MYLATLFDLTYQLALSAYNLCKQVGSRLDPTKPDLDPDYLALKEFIWKKLILKKNQQATRKHAKLLSNQSVKGMTTCYKTNKCF